MILATLGLRGKMNIRRLSHEALLKLPTARRWLEKMRRLDLVWITNRRTKPKDEMVHSLTPRGIVLAFNIIEPSVIHSLISHHGSIAPAYILYYEKFSKRGLLGSAKKIITENDLIHPSDVDSNNNVSRYLLLPNMLTVEKNIMNNIFIKTVLDKNLHIKEDGYRQILIELINDDKDFKNAWSRWIIFHEFTIRELKAIVKEARIASKKL